MAGSDAREKCRRKEEGVGAWCAVWTIGGKEDEVAAIRRLGASRCDQMNPRKPISHDLLVVSVVESSGKMFSSKFIVIDYATDAVFKSF